MTKGLLSKDEILNLFYREWIPEIKTEILPIQKVLGYVLSKDYYAKYSIPVVRSSSFDGIAVRFSDFINGIPDISEWKLNEDYTMADTGDDFLEPFDTVIRIEQTKFENNTLIEISEAPQKLAEGTRTQGSRITAGECVGNKEDFLTALKLSNLVAGGYSAVEVYSKPKIVYIPTGSELIASGRKPSRGDNIESNGVMVTNLINSWGFDCISLPICNDIKGDLELVLQNTLDFGDIILINGGSSKGSEDFNSELIKKHSTFWHHKAAAVPGLPVGIGLINNRPVINLPGPPLATFSVLQWLVKEIIYHGMNRVAPRSPIMAILKEEFSGPPELDFTQLVTVYEEDGRLFAKLLPMRDREADIMKDCNAYFVAEAGKTYKMGEPIILERLFEG